jgi:methyl-accepting chemotaxis protein
MNPVLFSDIERLSCDMESEFLALGERLYHFRDRSRTISEQSAEMGSKLNGSDLKDLIGRLHQFRKRITGMEEDSNHAVAVLSDIHAHFRAISRPLTSLIRVVKFLDIICVIVKIEDSRFEALATGFGTTAQSLSDLGKEIRVKSENLDTRTSSIANEIQYHLRSIQQKEQDQNTQARLILEKILSSLDILQGKRSDSAVMMERLSGQYQSIAKSVGEIVQSLQFHDITRQRIEHSASAVREIGQCMKDYRLNLQEASLAEAITLSRIQGAQLRETKGDLYAAVRRIKDSLRLLAGEIGAIIRETRGLAGATGRQDDSFLENIERNLSSLRMTTKNYGRIHGEIASALSAVSSIAEEIASFAGNIKEIGTSMRIVAMNASVNAARIGEEGSSLGVLARDTQTLSTETAEQIGRISDSLQSVVDLVRGLDGMVSGGFPGLSQGAYDMTAGLDHDLEDMIRRMQSVNTSATDTLSVIENLSGELLHDITGAIVSFESPEILAEAIESVCNRFESFVDRAVNHLPEETVREASRNIQHLAERYTMKRERDVHRSVAGFDEDEQRESFDTPVIENELTLAAVGNDSDNFGDNVELF